MVGIPVEWPTVHTLGLPGAISSLALLRCVVQGTDGKFHRVGHGPSSHQ